jgi:hypothetical protein
MKKALLIAFVVAAFSQAKAQQLFNVKPADSLKNNLFEQYFKVQPQNQLPWLQPRLNLNEALVAGAGQVKISRYDHMPVADLQGYSKMPVVKLGGFDRMPVLKPAEGTVIVVPDLKKQTP